MLVDVSKAIHAREVQYSFDERGEIPAFEFNHRLITFTSPVEVTAAYVYDGDALTVKGRLKATAAAPCDRCLEKRLLDFDIDFTEVFAPQGEEVYPLDGETVDLERMVQDLVAMNMPARVLCSEDCKGLCPVCGQNLNDGLCGCENEDNNKAADSPFSALKDLFHNDEEV